MPLASRFAARSDPVRLALLRRLRQPRTLKEIKVPAGGDGDDARPLARQTVKERLERLVASGLVVARETEREYGPTIEYVLDHQALFALSEEFRELAKVRPDLDLDGTTIVVGDPRAQPVHMGPSLLLVKGLGEGRRFELGPKGREEWWIGRRRGLDISLDHDPFVSSENTRVLTAGGGFFVEDGATSRNGTWIDFRRLREAERVQLRSADVVGVGRSLLLFRE